MTIGSRDIGIIIKDKPPQPAQISNVRVLIH